MAVDDAYTKLLLHCDGADGSTTFIDEGGHTVTPGGNAQIDTAIVKFGTGACLMDGTTDNLSVAASDDWDVGSGDFTIDFWYYPAAVVNTGLAYLSSTTHYALGLTYHYVNANKVSLWASSNGSSWDLITSDTAQGRGSIALTTSAWNHVALVRNGNNWMTFINGVKDLDLTVAGTVIDKNEPILIGAWTGPIFDANGSFDEYRISKGIARWTANFTPPTTSYPPPTTNYLKFYRRTRFPGKITGL